MPNPIAEQINSALLDAEAKLAVASDEAAVEEVRIHILGRKGLLASLSGVMGTLSPEERKTAGIAFNNGRERCHELIDAALLRIKSSSTGR